MRRRQAGPVIAALICVVLSLPSVAVAAGPRAATATAAPEDCTIVGTEGPDTLRGTAGPDVICGLGGPDTIRGLGGADTILGGPGPDRLAGGRGVDSIRSGPGADLCAPDPADVRRDACPIDAVGPSAIDTTVPDTVNAGETLVIRWHVADPAGVQLTWARVGGASGFVAWCEFEGLGTLVEGTPEDGTWERTCDVPADAVNGTYGIVFGGRDSLGNLLPEMAVRSFEIVGGSGDADAPVISGFSAVGTPVRGEPFTVEWRATDETGVRYAIAWFAEPNGTFLGSNGMPAVTYTDPFSERIDGTAKDGTWRQTVTFPDSAPAGTWNVWISRRDTLGNGEMTLVATVELPAP